MDSRTMSVFRLCIAVSMMAWLAVAASAVTVSVMDASGAPVDTLQVLVFGDELLIPLNALAVDAGWEQKGGAAGVQFLTPDAAVLLSASNHFVRVGDDFLQLRLPPQEWDGVLWLPASQLADVSNGHATFRRDSLVIHLPTGAVKSSLVSESSTVEPSPDTTGGAWSLRTVIVDPGHGGKDPGAVGLYGLSEKGITLDVARRLGNVLVSHGVAAELTRTRDDFVRLKDRIRFASEKRGDLFISIHCNSFRDTSIGGVETYFLSPARTQRAVDVALLENSVLALENGNGAPGGFTAESLILATMATSQHLKESESWAASTVREITAGTALAARGVDQAGFYVLIGVGMPAILLECGYLSSPRDAAILGTEPGRQALADALARSVLSMKNALEKEARK